MSKKKKTPHNKKNTLKIMQINTVMMLGEKSLKKIELAILEPDSSLMGRSLVLTDHQHKSDLLGKLYWLEWQMLTLLGNNSRANSHHLVTPDHLIHSIDLMEKHENLCFISSQEIKKKFINFFDNKIKIMVSLNLSKKVGERRVSRER